MLPELRPSLRHSGRSKNILKCTTSIMNRNYCFVENYSVLQLSSVVTQKKCAMFSYKCVPIEKQC